MRMKHERERIKWYKRYLHFSRLADEMMENYLWLTMKALDLLEDRREIRRKYYALVDQYGRLEIVCFIDKKRRVKGRKATSGT